MASLGVGVVASVLLVVVPLSVFRGVVIGGSLVHLGRWLCGGTRQGVGLLHTIRLMAYGQGIFQSVILPLQLVAMVPLVGILASLVTLPLLLVYLVFLGMAQARLHRTDPWRGICAVLAPFVLFCCCFGMALAVLVPLLARNAH